MNAYLTPPGHRVGQIMGEGQGQGERLHGLVAVIISTSISIITTYYY